MDHDGHDGRRSHIGVHGRTTRLIRGPTTVRGSRPLRELGSMCPRTPGRVRVSGRARGARDRATRRPGAVRRGARRGGRVVPDGRDPGARLTLYISTQAPARLAIPTLRRAWRIWLASMPLVT